MPKAKTQAPCTTISDCRFEIINSTNEFTRDAVVALANAAAANAKAIEAAALALNGAGGVAYGVKIGQ